jgi:hypothetical protein
MSDEWTWDERQDTLDYRQWKAESQWEDHLIRQSEGLAKLEQGDRDALDNAWPSLPADLEGIDRFAEHGITGDEEA